MHLAHVGRGLRKAHDVQLPEAVEVELADEAADVGRLEHGVGGIEELPLELRLKNERDQR